jgi:hypothetical protein
LPKNNNWQIKKMEDEETKTVPTDGENTVPTDGEKNGGGE